jgi:hypothetical protein
MRSDWVIGSDILILTRAPEKKLGAAKLTRWLDP